MAVEMKIPLSPWLSVVYCCCEGGGNEAIIGFLKVLERRIWLFWMMMVV
jgi:hypothetical protein